MWPGRREATGRRRATALHAACRGGLECSLGAGDGDERTPNMDRMFVTLEVSKLSGWLNADVRCRESKGGHTLRDDVRGMWEAGGGGRPRCTHSVQARARPQMKQGTRGGAHV